MKTGISAFASASRRANFEPGRVGARNGTGGGFLVAGLGRMDG